MRRDWTLLMPATRPSVAWAALWSASMGQTLRPRDAIVADNGPVSVTASREWRFVADVLAHANIGLRVIRRLPGPAVNVGRIRHLLLTEAEAEVVGFCDDDVLWEPRLAQRLTKALDEAPMEVAWVCALQLTPNNEGDTYGWTAPAYPSPKFGDEPDGQAYPVTRSSGHALFISMDRYRDGLADWSRPNGEDDALTAHLGHGLRVVERACRGWEMAHPEGRKWQPAAPAAL